jgi:hypothetical protein
MSERTATCIFCEHPIDSETAVLANASYELLDDDDRAHVECRMLNEALERYGFQSFGEVDIHSLVWYFATANGGPKPHRPRFQMVVNLECGCVVRGDPQEFEVLLSPGNRRYDCDEHGKQWVNSWSRDYKR